MQREELVATVGGKAFAFIGLDAGTSPGDRPEEGAHRRERIGALRRSGTWIPTGLQLSAAQVAGSVEGSIPTRHRRQHEVP